MNTYLLKIKETGEEKLYKTIAALLADNTDIGLTKNTLYPTSRVFKAISNYQYTNEKVVIQEIYASGMKEVMLSKISQALTQKNIPHTIKANKTLEIPYTDDAFRVVDYKKGFLLDGTPKKQEEILRLLI